MKVEEELPETLLTGTTATFTGTSEDGGEHERVEKQEEGKKDVKPMTFNVET